MSARQKKLQLNLDRALSVGNLERAWKGSVRTGLRRQSLEDLHDFLDVHRNLKSFSKRLRESVIAGHYVPRAPEFVLMEKRDGISRRLAIPDPGTALALQAMVDQLEPRLRAAQPTQNAFYSRSHSHTSVEDFDGPFGYPWWLLWPEFQKRILGFTKNHPHLVVTDVANYFDSVPLRALRNTIAGQGDFGEDFLNFLFYLLEAFVWRPYYMPASGVGLPQLNFDAPRLLAHAYLFRADEELDTLTSGQFVRWMDDIDAGVPSVEAGKELLRSLETALNSQGLRLNAGKTNILSAKESLSHFCVVENMNLTTLQNSIKFGVGSSALRAKQGSILRRRYKAFQSQRQTGNAEKVHKRYLGLFGNIKDSSLVGRLPSLLEDSPGLRGPCFKYLQMLGPSPGRLQIIDQFVRSGHCGDDASLFGAIACLVAWETPGTGQIVNRIAGLAAWLHRHGKPSLMSRICASLWLLAKYGDETDLTKMLASVQSYWVRSPWVARQVAAVTPRLAQSDRNDIRHAMAKNGLLQGLAVLESLEAICACVPLDRQLNAYLLHTGSPHTLPKILVAIEIIRGGTEPHRQKLQQDMMAIVGDRRFRKLLRDA